MFRLAWRRACLREGAFFLQKFTEDPPLEAEPSSMKELVEDSSAFPRWQRWALLGVFALIVVLRLPNAWVHGRFQDEEATVFLAYAWHHSVADALFRPFAGYWNLGATGPTALVAQLVKGGALPLERAPYLTMLIALAFQLLPAILLLTAKAKWLAKRVAVAAALLIVAIAPATEEVWLNVLHIQFHLALCVALILALNVPEHRAARISYGVLLFVAPLCGPGAIVVLPLFALRSFVDRDKGRAMQLLCIAAGTAIQLIFFYGTSPVRGQVAEPAAIAAAMFVRVFALPAIGIDGTYSVARVIGDSRAAQTMTWTWFAAATVILFSTMIVISLRRRDAAVWLVLSSLLISAASLFGMVLIQQNNLFSVFAGERYNFLPVVLIGLALVVIAMRGGFPGARLAGFLCVLLLANGAYNYRKPLHYYSDGPSWPEQVAVWRTDHRHPLAVWPRPWTADLSDETRPCSAPGPDLTKSSDPRYCESGWIAGFYSGK